MSMTTLQDPYQTSSPSHPALEHHTLDLTKQGTLHVAAEVPKHAGTHTILLAEDNDDLRAVMQVFLEAMGYTVFACPDGAVALQVFRSGVPVDLLLTDIEMPGKSGVELARELTALRSSLPVVFVSGSLLAGETRCEMQARHWVFLSKPYGFPALLATIQPILARGQQLAA